MCMFDQHIDVLSTARVTNVNGKNKTLSITLSKLFFLRAHKPFNYS